MCFQTETANHGVDIVYEMDLQKWDGIAVCSGDGLAYEVSLFICNFGGFLYINTNKWLNS